MTDLNKADRAALEDLDTLAPKCMRSKVILKTLDSLSERGLIDFNPFDGTAKITDAGKAALLIEKQG